MQPQWLELCEPKQTKPEDLTTLKQTKNPAHTFFVQKACGENISKGFIRAKSPASAPALAPHTPTACPLGGATTVIIYQAQPLPMPCAIEKLVVSIFQQFEI